MRLNSHPVGALVATSALVLLTAAGTVHADPDSTPGGDRASNMGLCSAYLGHQLGVRDDVNHLLKEFGEFLPDGPFSSPGELYRIRAHEHPATDAATECAQRPPTP